MYNTKQRSELLEYLVAHPHTHITVNDICRYFRERKRNIGVATVYRHLEKMVDEGLVNKYIIDKNSPACFEYVAGDGEHETTDCFHCKCDSCGKLIHLHCEELKELRSHLESSHAFRLNPLRTVFYGRCSSCADTYSGS